MNYDFVYVAKKGLLNEKLGDEFQKRIRGSLCCITYARKEGNFLEAYVG
jgi:hypothetical protein